MASKPTTENDEGLFREAIKAAGLLTWVVRSGHWTIYGGKYQVRCWLHGTYGSGFRYQKVGVMEPYVTGTVADAIQLAVPPKQEPVLGIFPGFWHSGEILGES